MPAKTDWTDGNTVTATALNTLGAEVNNRVLATPTVTRTMSLSNGGLGGTVATSLGAATAGGFRMTVKLPVTTTQWRIKIRHYDIVTPATKTALTGKKIVHGDGVRASTGTALETGSFGGNTATTIVGSDFTIPGDGSWYTGPWVTAGGDQFDAGVEHLVGISWTSASTAIQCAAGQCWYWSNSTSATDPTVAGSAATNQTSYIPLDWVIEYQCTSTHKTYLFVGDSITEGISGPKGTTGTTPTPLWRNYPWQWAARNNALVTNISIAGIGAVTYANPSYITLWDRQDMTLNSQWDGVVIAAGSNDLFAASRSVAQLQADVLGIIDIARSRFGNDIPIYIANLIARNITTTGETNRQSYNQWVSQWPDDIAGIVDLDGATRGITNTALFAAYTTDNIHPSWLGQIAMADACAVTLQ